MRPNEIAKQSLGEPVDTVEYKSKSRDDVVHIVTVYDSGYCTCTCEAFKYRRTCKHAGAQRYFNGDVDAYVKFRKESEGG